MSTTDYDVVIVGAGISGALIANELARKNVKVLILEAGETSLNRQNNIDDFYAAPMKTPGAPYPSKADAPRPDVPLGPAWKTPDEFEKDPRYYFVQTGENGTQAFGSTYERMTGGTTLHWLGTALRFHPEDFETKTRFNFADDWPLTYDDLESWYTKAEFEIGVAGDAAVDEGMGIKHSKPYPMKPIPASWSDQVIKKQPDGKVFDGKTISVDPTPQARNTEFYQNRPICMGNTNCVPICPIQAKYDATVHLKMALNQRREPAEYLHPLLLKRIAHAIALHHQQSRQPTLPAKRRKHGDQRRLSAGKRTHLTGATLLNLRNKTPGEPIEHSKEKVLFAREMKVDAALR